jgi:hypothetical protein
MTFSKMKMKIFHVSRLDLGSIKIAKASVHTETEEAREGQDELTPRNARE